MAVTRELLVAGTFHGRWTQEVPAPLVGGHQVRVPRPRHKQHAVYILRRLIGIDWHLGGTCSCLPVRR